MKSSLKGSCAMSVRPCRRSTLSVLPVSSTLSKIGPLVCGGGPFRRDGAPNCVPSLHRRIACFRRALCSAMDRVFRFTGSFFYVPNTACALRSSCRSVDREMFFLCFAEPHLAPQSGICSCSVGLIPGTFAAPVQWMRRAPSHGFFSF